MKSGTPDIFEMSFCDHATVVERSKNIIKDACLALVEASAKTIKHGGKIVFFGNGGSAADAQHLAAELTIRYKADRAPIAAISLTTDTSALTAAINDLGADAMFARQVRALCRAGDLVVGITTSGNSSNVLHALRTAREMGCTVAVFTGKGGGQCTSLADIALVVPSDVTARIQEIHILVGHIFCESLERELGYVLSPATAN